MAKVPDGETFGCYEDAGKSMLICDVCEDMVSKGRGIHDGDPCHACAERQPDDDTDAAIIRAANAYGRK